MKTRINKIILKTGWIFCTLLYMSCAENKNEETKMEQPEPPVIEAVSAEYGKIVRKVHDALQSMEFDAFGNYFTDDAEWYWPDGSFETRTVIKGKDNLVSFWKDWKETFHIDTIEFSQINTLSLKNNVPTKYYKVKGVMVLYYGDMTLNAEGKTAKVRQQITYVFNADKKIQKAFLYYDRTTLLKTINTSVDLNKME